MERWLMGAGLTLALVLLGIILLMATKPKGTAEVIQSFRHPANFDAF